MTFVSGFALLLRSKLIQTQQLELAERVCPINLDAGSILTQIESWTADLGFLSFHTCGSAGPLVQQYIMKQEKIWVLPWKSNSSPGCDEGLG